MAKTAQKKGSRKTSADLLNVAFVWDMSYSMATVDSATREGTASYLNDLQKQERKLAKKKGLTASGKIPVFTRLSLTVFDTVFEPWVVNEPIGAVDVDKIIGDYMPRGNTALYDAIAQTITTTEKRMRDEKREDEKVLVIIMTDGQENSSVEYSLHADGRRRILELIKSYEAKGNWTFVWLGAGEAALAEAAHVGIARGNTVAYASTHDSVAAVSASLGHVTATRRAANQGQTVTAFADAGLPTDYTNPEKPEYGELDPDES